MIFFEEKCQFGEKWKIGAGILKGEIMGREIASLRRREEEKKIEFGEIEISNE